MTEAEIEQLIQAIQAHPQLFYDVFIDPSFIRATEQHAQQSAEDDLVGVESNIGGLDQSRVFDFITLQDDHIAVMWENLVDLRFSSVVRINNNELLPYNQIRSAISGLLKASHIRHAAGCAILSAIWSPSNNPALISDNFQGAKQGSPDLVGKKYSPNEQIAYLASELRRLLENPDSMTYELMQPFIHDVLNNQCKLLIAYEEHTKAINIETAQRIAQKLSDAIPNQPLSLKIEQRLFEHLLNNFLERITPLPDELEEVFFSYSAGLTHNQVNIVIRDELFELCDISVSEGMMHDDYNLNEMLPISIFYHTQTIVLSTFAKIIYKNYKSLVNEDMIFEELKNEIINIIKQKYQLIIRTIVSNVMKKYIMLMENKKPGIGKNMSPKELENKRKAYIAEEQRISQIVTAGFDRVTTNLFNHITPNLQGVLVIAHNATLSRILINAISSKFAQRVLPSEAYSQLNRYLQLSSGGDGLNSTPVKLWALKVKAAAEHALAYNFAKFCVANDTGEGVSPKLLARFKGNTDEAVNTRLRYLTLELLLAPNQFQSGVNPELDRAIKMYDSYVKQPSGEQSPGKRLQTAISADDFHAIQVRIRKGDLNDHDLLMLANMNRRQRMEIFGFMLPQRNANVVAHAAASSSVRRGPGF